MTLTIALLFGLAASGLTAIFRVTIGDRKPEWLLHKPLSCDLCMSFWTTAAVAAGWTLEHPTTVIEGAIGALAGIGGALLVTKAANRLGG